MKEYTTNITAFVTPLTLREPTGKLLQIPDGHLMFDYQGDTVGRCRLIVNVDFASFQYIMEQSLFHLKPEVSGNIQYGQFVQENPFSIELLLHPDLLPRVVSYYQHPEQAVNLMAELMDADPQDWLVQTEAWYTLCVSQNQQRYPTLWNYLDLEVLSKQDTPSASTVDAARKYFQQLALQVNSDALPINEQIVDRVLDLAKTLMANDRNQDTISEQYFEQFASILKDVITEQLNHAVRSEDEQSMYDVLLDYIRVNEWPCEEISTEKAVRLLFQSDRESWLCIAQVNEANDQLFFYSILPVELPPEKRQTMMEFVTRANYNLTIGNFEMDLDDGEVRYKTSIDVEGNGLNHALCKSIFFANWSTSDRYLPAMRALVSTNISALEAIHLVEASSP